MILRKRLRLLISALQTFYVFAGNSSFDIEQHKITSESEGISFWNHVEYTTTLETSDVYLQQPVEIEEFPDEITEIVPSEFLFNNDTKSDDVNISSLNTSIDDFIKKFKHTFSPLYELNDNEIISIDDIKNESSTYNATGTVKKSPLPEL